MKDLNGSYKWSPVRFVEQQLVDKDIQVVPNPTQGKVQITMHNGSRNAGTLQIFNSLGSLVYQYRIPAQLKQHALNLDLAYLPAGVYAIQYGNTTTKLILN